MPLFECQIFWNQTFDKLCLCLNVKSFEICSNISHSSKVSGKYQIMIGNKLIRGWGCEGYKTHFPGWNSWWLLHAYYYIMHCIIQEIWYFHSYRHHHHHHHRHHDARLCQRQLALSECKPVVIVAAPTIYGKNQGKNNPQPTHTCKNLEKSQINSWDQIGFDSASRSLFYYSMNNPILILATWLLFREI